MEAAVCRNQMLSPIVYDLAPVFCWLASAWSFSGGISGRKLVCSSLAQRTYQLTNFGALALF